MFDIDVSYAVACLTRFSVFSEELDVESDDSGMHEDTEDMSKWVDQSILMRASFKMSPTDTFFVKDHVMEGVPKTHRCKETVCLAWKAGDIEALDLCVPTNQVMRTWQVDVNDAIRRKPWGPALCTMGQRSLPFSFFHKRVYDPLDLRQR